MAMREYRKGNWTVEETMILIEAKKKDDERRKLSRSKQTSVNIIGGSATASPTSSGGGTSSGSKPVTELRWKWVEDYCWGRGCFRSQNQCNDKWDNLMRDYKKVRDYQRSLTETTTTTTTANQNNKSYWDMDKIERKDKGLPTNMLLEIYQALFDVVEPATTSFSLPPPPPLPGPTLQLSPAVLPPPRLLPTQPSSSAFLSPPSPALVEAETSEQYSHDPELSPAKRRRKEGGSAAATQTAAAATATAAAAAAAAASTSANSVAEEVSTAICRSATMISEAIQASGEKEERRHREMMKLQESRLRIEESKLEINRQGINGLTDAINRLATSIFTWANSHKSQQGP